MENSPVGDSRANGAAERALQAIAEQVRVIRRGLEQRLELRLSGKHPVTAWLVERAADLLSKYHVGDDGKTGYERWKGNLSMERRLSLAGSRPCVLADTNLYLWISDPLRPGPEVMFEFAASTVF